MSEMNLMSWNVNGIRAILQKGFLDIVAKQNPDVLSLQEVKARDEQVNLEIPGYLKFWNAAQRPGYSGTAVFTKKEPLSVAYGMGLADHDTEGRVITVEFPKYYLVNVYTPNSGEELKRLSYRQTWDDAFRNYILSLEKKKPVIVCGDLNVAHHEIDLANPKSNRESSGFTDQERQSFTKFIESGYLDSFRVFNQEPKQYTWWTYRFGARSRNVGWRIDYFCPSKELQSMMKNAYILPELMGSDHCPVGLTLKE